MCTQLIISVQWCFTRLMKLQSGVEIIIIYIMSYILPLSCFCVSGYLSQLALLWESIVNTPLPNEDIHSGEDENGYSAEEEADVSLSCFYNIATPNASFLNIDLNNKTSTKSSPCESEEVSSAVDNGSGDANCQVEVDSSFNYSLPEVHTSLSDHILERDTSNSPVLSPVSVNNDSSQILSLDDYVTVRNENDNIRELEERKESYIVYQLPT